MSAANVFFSNKSDYRVGRSDENAEISSNRAFSYVCQPTYIAILLPLFPMGLKFLSTLARLDLEKAFDFVGSALQPKLLSGMRTIIVECLSTLKFVFLSYILS